MFQQVNTVTEIRLRQAGTLTHQRDGLDVTSSSNQFVHFPLAPEREPTPQSTVHPHIEPLRSTGPLAKFPQGSSLLIKHHHLGQNALLAFGERAAAELKQRWRTLQHITISSSRISDIARAALVLNGIWK